MERISAVILDSQEVFAAGLVSLLARDRVRTHATASLDRATAVLAADPSVRLAILDVAAPGVSVAGAIAGLRERFPDLRILLSTSQPSRAEILHCLGLGVHGVLCRAQPAREIAAAIRVVMAGGIFVPPAVSDLHAAAEVTEAPLHAVGAGMESRQPVISAPATTWAGAQLSARQEAVLRLLRLGFSNKEIARELGLAEGTVKVHLAALYRILRVRNRAGAAASTAETTARRA